MFFRIRFCTDYWRSASIILIAGLVLSCEEATESLDSEVPKNAAESIARNLSYADAWQLTIPKVDPLLLHRPADHFCETGAWGQELGGLEPDTGECNYFSLSQSMAEDILVGDRLELLMWWQPLISTEPATGHLAILVGDTILWEEYVPIPSTASVRNIELFAPQDFLAGTPITLHLHNHGANTWHFHHFLVHPQSRFNL